MEIKTKFNIGQRVYVITAGEIKLVTITNISTATNLSISQSTTDSLKITYCFDNGSFPKEEKDVYTKEELIEYINSLT